MSGSDAVYLGLMMKILSTGETRSDRTGTGTKSLFGEIIKFDVGKEFPLLTTKKMNWDSIVGEIDWFLRGETNVNTLVTRGGKRLKFWDAWADADGELGPTYGKQLRDWNGIDQWDNLLAGLRDDPYGRRHIVSLWNVAEVDQCRLPPCHVLTQWSIRDGGRVDCIMYQRSCDYFLGAPFNIAGYALLMKECARIVGVDVGVLTIMYGDCHIYLNHIEQCQEQVSRDWRVFAAPTVTDAWELEGYGSWGALRGDISV